MYVWWVMCTLKNIGIELHTRTRTHQGLEGVPVKPFCGNDFFAEKKA